MGFVYNAAAIVAVIATAMVITRRDAVHALLYLVLSLLAVAVAYYAIGAPFAAALEVIIYAGAIMVLFVFVVMMLNLGGEQARRESRWLHPRIWIGPAVLATILLGLLVYAVLGIGGGAHAIGAQAVGLMLYGPYVLAVEAASMLLLAGLVGAFHLGRREEADERMPERRGS